MAGRPVSREREGRPPASGASGEPARGYRWPDAAPGNFLAMRHGADSPRTVAPVAAELAGELTEVAPWCSRPAFSAEVAAWARAEARVRLLCRWLDEVGLIDDDGEPRAALSALERAEGRAARCREALGLSPAAWARLYATVAEQDGSDVEAIKAEGRRILEAGRTAT